MIKKPELLAPAGDLEKLKIAVMYGADAVYLGGHAFSLRAKAKNFGPEEIRDGVEFAHKNNVRVYVTVNIFAHNSDLTGMPEYFLQLQSLGVDALIISDPGVFAIARETVPGMELHISTQANVTNVRSALFWHELGAKRVILARELPLDDIFTINQGIPKSLEIECFVHGAMCISYSGRCLLSNFFNNRDSNRGNCSQPCRWEYHLSEKSRPNEYLPIEETERGTFIMNSSDLCMIEHIPQLITAGIGSFKIEGRMKTPHYTAVLVKAYRQAIDDYFTDPELYAKNLPYYKELVEQVSHRHYSTGFYFNNPSQIYHSSSYIRTVDFVGIVLDYFADSGLASVEQRNKFSVGDRIEFFTPEGKGFTQEIKEIYDENMIPLSSVPHAQQKVRIKVDHPVRAYDLLRKSIDEK